MNFTETEKAFSQAEKIACEKTQEKYPEANTYGEVRVVIYPNGYVTGAILAGHGAVGSMPDIMRHIVFVPKISSSVNRSPQEYFWRIFHENLPKNVERYESLEEYLGKNKYSLVDFIKSVRSELKLPYLDNGRQIW
jgi:hypothetical protein